MDDFQKSKDSGVHKQLQILTGNWQGTAKTWYQPNILADESSIRGTIRPVLDGRFMMHEYNGELEGEKYSGMAWYGYDIKTGNLQSAWIDSAHMGTEIMLSECKKTDLFFSVLGHYSGGTPRETWGWRTEISIINPENILITAWNITPAGNEAKAVEINYKRVN